MRSSNHSGPKISAVLLVVLAIGASRVLADQPVPRLVTPDSETYDSIDGLVFSPDGSRLVVGNCNGWIDVLKMPLGEKHREFLGKKFLADLAFSPKGDIVAGFCCGYPDIFLLDASTWKSLKPLSIGDMRIHKVAFSPDGVILAVLGTYITPGDRAWGDSAVRFWDFPRRKVIREIRLPHVNRHVIRAIVFSPDGKTLVTTVETVLREVRSDRFYEIKYWDVQTGAAARQRTIATEQEDAEIALLPDGKRLISAGNEGREEGRRDDVTLKIWDMSTGALVQKLKGYTGDRCMLLLPLRDDKAITGDYGTIRLWDLKTSDEIGKIDLGPTNCEEDGSLHSRITRLALSPDGQVLACATSTFFTDLRIWRLSDAFPVLVHGTGALEQRTPTTTPAAGRR
jgi:WD40 repeat protein